MAMGEGSGRSTEGSGSGGVLWMIIWFIFLIVAAIWISGFCAWLYIIVIPLTVCAPPLAYVTDILLRLTQLTYFCAKNLMDRNTFSEAMAKYSTTVPPTAQTIT